MKATIQDVANLFERSGWAFNELDEHTIHTLHTGTLHYYPIIALLHDDWLTISVCQYLPKIPPEKFAEVSKLLLKLDAQISMVKYAVENDKDVILRADVLAETKPDFYMFNLCMDLLIFYAEHGYPHLYKLITGEELEICKEEVGNE